MKYARLKPYNGKQHKLKVYTVFGIKFMENRGWYEVEDDVAAYLSTIKQIQDSLDSEYSADAFDVVNTMAEAQAIDERERKKAERALAENAHKTRSPQTTRVRTGAAKPPPPRATSGDLTSDDIPGTDVKRARKGDSFDDQDDSFPEDGDLTQRTRTPAEMVDGADVDEAPAAEAEATAGDAEASEATEHIPAARRGKRR